MLVAGTAMGQLAALLVSPVIARIYSPTELGAFGVFAAALAILSSFSTGRLDVAAMLPEKDTDALGLLLLSGVMSAAVALVVTVALISFADKIADSLKLEVSAAYLAILPLSLLGSCGFQILSHWGIRKKIFSVIAGARLRQTLATLAAQIGFGILQLGPMGLASADATGRLAGLQKLVQSVRAAASEQDRSFFEADRLRRLLSRYKRFPLLSMPPAVLNTAAQQSPNFVIAAMFGAAPVGFYVMAERLIGVPLSVLAQAISQVFFSEAVEQKRFSTVALAKRTALFGTSLLALGIVVVIPVSVLAPRMFSVVLGERWEAAGYYVQAIAPMLICQFSCGPIGAVLDVLERQNLHLLREFLRTALFGVGVLLILAEGTMPPLQAVAILGNMLALGYLIGALLIAIALWQQIKRERSKR